MTPSWKELSVASIIILLINLYVMFFIFEAREQKMWGAQIRLNDEIVRTFVAPQADGAQMGLGQQFYDKLK